MTAYNLFGKRCALPMLSDAMQGLVWGTLAVYGAFVAAGYINALTLVAASFGFGFLFLVNGVHGGLRDLENDVAIGCTTTVSFAGRISPTAMLYVPKPYAPAHCYYVPLLVFENLNFEWLRWFVDTWRTR
jgi:4-hydroxybenzoate polyprenyltransferase